jgi:hypothetical protein
LLFFTDTPATVKSSAFVRRPSSELEEPFSPSASKAKQKQSSSFEGFEEFSNDSDPFATQPATVQAVPTSFAGVSSDLLFDNTDMQSTRSGFSNFDTPDATRAPPSRQTSTRSNFDLPQAPPSRQTSARSNFDLPQAPPSRQTSVRSVNKNLLDDDDNNGTTAPPPSRATSAFTNDFDSDFSLPTAPSRTNSVRNSASTFSVFGNDDGFINQQTQSSSSKPSAASLLFELETSLPPAAVLTPTPQNSSKSSTNEFDLLHSSNFNEMDKKQQQRKSNPLELLNLYDQPLQPTKASPAPVMLGMNPHASNSPAFMNLPPAGGRTSIPISPFNPSPMQNHMSSSPGMRSPGMPFVPPNPMGSSNPNLMMYPPRPQFSNPGGPTSMGIGGMPYGSPMNAPGPLNNNRGLPPAPPNPFAKGPAPSPGMRTSYGMNSDPFDSLGVLNNKK